jgi:hypothetical protein
MAGRYRNAEMDPVRFPAASMTSFLDRLAERGQHWIPIIDAGVAKSDGYVVAAEGDAADIWIKDVYGAPYVGQGAYLLYLSSLSLQPYSILFCRCRSCLPYIPLLLVHVYTQCTCTRVYPYS